MVWVKGQEAPLIPGALLEVVVVPGIRIWSLFNPSLMSPGHSHQESGTLN